MYWRSAVVRPVPATGVDLCLGVIGTAFILAAGKMNHAIIQSIEMFGALQVGAFFGLSRVGRFCGMGCLGATRSEG